MKYTAIRVIRGFENKYLIQAQKDTDYNWTTLAEMESKEKAESAAHYTARELSDLNNGYVPCYNFNGYGKGYYKGQVYKA